MTLPPAALLVAGLVLLAVGAELLVRGAATMATAAGVTPLVVGLTVVAFGTSSPELAASLGAAASGQPDLALGNVIGSNVFNVLLILGVSAAITPLVVNRQLLRFDVPAMIGVSVGAWALGVDGHFGATEGGLLVAAVVAYTGLLIRVGRRLPGTVGEEYAAELRGSRTTRRSVWLLSSLQVLVGLALLALGSRWLIHGAVAMARALDVSELLIGLTLVAAGTSLPEVATSVVAALRGHRDIAVGNVVGSNIFNLTAVLGTAAVIAPNGVTVSRQAAVLDMPVMVVVAMACWPLFFTGRTVARWEGGLLLALYAAYLGSLVVRAG